MPLVLDYAAAEPENVIFMFGITDIFMDKAIYDMAGRGRGNFMLLVKDFQEKKPYLLRRAFNDVLDFWGGVCKSLDVPCTRDSMICWNAESANTFLEFMHEWFQAIEIESEDSVPERSQKYLSGRGQELLSKIQSATECLPKTHDLSSFEEKTGNVILAPEWLNRFEEYAKQYPELFRLFNKAMVRMMDKNDYEDAGSVAGLLWFSQLKSAKKWTKDMPDL